MVAPKNTGIDQRLLSSLIGSLSSTCVGRNANTWLDFKENEFALKAQTGQQEQIV
jgi:hypothetical protein